jgi:hypothetical protein
MNQSDFSDNHFMAYSHLIILSRMPDYKNGVTFQRWAARIRMHGKFGNDVYVNTESRTIIEDIVSAGLAFPGSDRHFMKTFLVASPSDIVRKRLGTK